MRIGVDAMGGDFAPKAVVEGALLAKDLVGGDATIVLYGIGSEIEKLLPENSNNIEIVDCSEVIEMGDHPAEAFKKKPNSSIVTGFMHLAAGKIDGFASAGSTGAMMVGSMFVIKAIDGVERPTIATHYKAADGSKITLVDVGLNADCKAEVLAQYAVIGSIYAENICGVSNPRVALINIGSEEGKGNLTTKAAYELIKEQNRVNFVGNVEGGDIIRGGKADVVVCDGFVGNIVLKLLENLYETQKPQGVNLDYVDSMNYEEVGGTPVLGVNSTVVIGHGASSAKAVANMIEATRKAVKGQIVHKLKEAFSA